MKKLLFSLFAVMAIAFSANAQWTLTVQTLSNMNGDPTIFMNYGSQSSGNKCVVYSGNSNLLNFRQSKNFTVSINDRINVRHYRSNGTGCTTWNNTCSGAEVIYRKLEIYEVWPTYTTLVKTLDTIGPGATADTNALLNGFKLSDYSSGGCNYKIVFKYHQHCN